MEEDGLELSDGTRNPVRKLTTPHPYPKGSGTDLLMPSATAVAILKVTYLGTIYGEHWTCKSPAMENVQDHNLGMESRLLTRLF